MKIRGALNDNWSSLASTNGPQTATDWQLVGFAQWKIGPTGRSRAVQRPWSHLKHHVSTPKQMCVLVSQMAFCDTDGLKRTAACKAWVGGGARDLTPRTEGTELLHGLSATLLLPVLYSPSQARKLAASSDTAVTPPSHGSGSAWLYLEARWPLLTLGQPGWGSHLG